MSATTIILGDCITAMADLPANSVDAIVTDPPYGLGFMGKEWDKGGTMLGQIAAGLERSDAGPLARGGTHSRGYADNDTAAFGEWCRLWAVEALRVLKPGGHLLAFGGTRTWHRLAVAVEDAGFTIRDSIAWLYGSGFPKSLDVSKAIDKAAGAAREVVGKSASNGLALKPGRSTYVGQFLGARPEAPDVTAPATEDAARWQGWGTALKPAFEPVVVARKPFPGTVAANVLEYGTGALNIDASRIGTEPAFTDRPGQKSVGGLLNKVPESLVTSGGAGRWPANVILDEGQAAALDAQSGDRPGGNFPARLTGRSMFGLDGHEQAPRAMGDTGGASRFFYVAKAPKRERPVVDGVAHPTVKPLTLMRYLVRMVTPPGGVVLDPFLGSGTTAEAALLEGFDCIGIERGPEYLPLIDARLAKYQDDDQLEDDAA